MTQPEKTPPAKRTRPSTIDRVRKHCALYPPAHYTTESMVTMALVIEQMAPDRDPVDLMQFMDWATGRVIGRCAPQWSNPGTPANQNSLRTNSPNLAANVNRKTGMPTETELFANGLVAIDEVSRDKYGKPFAEVTPAKRKSILESIEDGNVTAGYWSQVPSNYFYRRFYTKLLHGMFAERREWVLIGILRSADPGENAPA